MKKLLTLLIVAVIALSLTACGGEDEPPKYPGDGPGTPWVDVFPTS